MSGEYILPLSAPPEPGQIVDLYLSDGSLYAAVQASHIRAVKFHEDGTVVVDYWCVPRVHDPEGPSRYIAYYTHRPVCRRCGIRSGCG